MPLLAQRVLSTYTCGGGGGGRGDTSQTIIASPTIEARLPSKSVPVELPVVLTESYFGQRPLLRIPSLEA